MTATQSMVTVATPSVTQNHAVMAQSSRLRNVTTATQITTIVVQMHVCSLGPLLVAQAVRCLPALQVLRFVIMMVFAEPKSFAPAISAQVSVAVVIATSIYCPLAAPVPGSQARPVPRAALPFRWGHRSTGSITTKLLCMARSLAMGYPNGSA